jgi:hypothetical protein
MPDLQPIAPDSANHLRQMGQFTADTFADGKYVEAFRDNYIGNSHYDWQVSRLVFDGDKLVHHWGVWGYQMRLDSSLLKVGGIGAVATHPDYRKQALMHRAAQASFEAMHAHGYDLSILRGRHYAKMGYARAWNYVTYRFKLEDFPPTAAAPAYARLPLAEVPSLDALYNQAYAAFSGSALRPTYRNKHSDDVWVYAWRDGAGNLAGYVSASPTEEEPKTLVCNEAVGDPGQALAVLADLHQVGGYENLACFTLPHAHPLLQVLRLGNCIVENRYFAVSGWRVRLINLHSTLNKLLPVLHERLGRSQFARWTGSLLLDGGSQQAMLRMNGGKIRLDTAGPAANVLHGGDALARLLIGSDEPDEVLRQEQMTCAGVALPLVCALFPNRSPMLSQWDEF